MIAAALLAALLSVTIIPAGGPHADIAAQALASELAACTRIVDPYAGSPDVLIQVGIDIVRGPSFHMPSERAWISTDLAYARITVLIISGRLVTTVSASTPIMGGWVWTQYGSVSIPLDIGPEIAIRLAKQVAPEVIHRLNLRNCTPASVGG